MSTPITIAGILVKAASNVAQKSTASSINKEQRTNGGIAEEEQSVELQSVQEDTTAVSGEDAEKPAEYVLPDREARTVRPARLQISDSTDNQKADIVPARNRKIRFNSRTARYAMIAAEVFGPPVSKRHRRR